MENINKYATDPDVSFMATCGYLITFCEGDDIIAVDVYVRPTFDEGFYDTRELWFEMNKINKNPVKNNFVAKYMEDFNTPKTHVDQTKKHKPKYVKPVHQIDIEDPHIDEQEIWHE